MNKHTADMIPMRPATRLQLQQSTHFPAIVQHCNYSHLWWNSKLLRLPCQFYIKKDFWEETPSETAKDSDDIRRKSWHQGHQRKEHIIYGTQIIWNCSWTSVCHLPLPLISQLQTWQFPHPWKKICSLFLFTLGKQTNSFLLVSKHVRIFFCSG